jgi:CDP-diacylglycerol--glycerol-3-phosphate 3-phosphatidyltransferase
MEGTRKSAKKMTLTDLAREWGHGIIEPVARLIARIGIPPNVLTMTGLAFNIGAAIVLSKGHIRLGGACSALAGISDALDGAVARIIGHRGRFGAFLDSIMDRLSEAAILLGLLAFYTRMGASQEIFLIYATIVGSLMVSYVRAKAEGLGIECKVGLLTRFERFLVITAGLLLDKVLIALWVLAVLSNFTALQRLYHVWRMTRSDEG